MAEGGGGGGREGSGQGAAGRGYSGSGGSSQSQVVSYTDLESFDVDHYDCINAPQFVDFTNDDPHAEDPQADLFFENHREEDDFLISIDNISPTMQLLQEHQRSTTNEEDDSNVLDSITQEINEAVAKDGMKDVQVVYYASPSSTTTTAPGSNNKKTNNKWRKTNSLNSTNDSSNCCFYTPMSIKDTTTTTATGDMDYYYDDKENCAPLQPSLNTPEFKDPVKKLSYSAALVDDDDKTPIQELYFKNDAVNEQHGQQNKEDDRNAPYAQSTGLIAELGKLQLLSSDDEGAAVEEAVEESYTSPTKSITTDETLVNALLKTPGTVKTLNVSSAVKMEQQEEDKIKPKNNIAITKIQGKLTIPQSPDASKRVPKCKKTVPAPPPLMPLKRATTAATTSSRLPMKADHQRYVSLAEQISKYQKNTPDRFRTLPRGQTGYLKRSTSCELKPPTTAPATSTHRGRSPSKSPNRKNSATLLVRRNRASSVSIPKNTTSLSTSRPSSSGGSSGAAIQHRTTIPQPFNFSTIRKRNPSADGRKDVPADFKFKARLAPKSQGGQVGVNGRPQIKATLPIAPHFASDDRIRERHVKRAQSATQSPTGSTTRASRIPVMGGGSNNANASRIPSAMDLAPSAPPRKTTALKPFSFDQRDQQMLRRKEEKIKQEIEEESKIPEFHANPLPTFEQKLPKKRPAPPTHVEPFNFTSDQRGSSYKEALKAKLEEDEREFRAMTTFHANPPRVLHHPPFEPELSGRPPLETLDFTLNTEKRAVEREQFDNHLRQKELDAERLRQEEQMRLEEQQRLEEIERRRQMVHKAQPFKAPKPFEPKASKKPLTIPQSPAFHWLPSQRRIVTPMKNTSM